MRRSNSTAAPHAITSSRPSHCPRRPAIRAAIGHAPQPSSPYRFSSPRGSLQARHAGRHLSAITSSSRPLVSSYLVSKSVSFLYRLVYQCRIRYIVPSGFSRRVLLVSVSSPGVEYDIAIIPILIISYIHRILVSLYSCIFYIYRIHHIHYIHSSTRHDEPRHNIKASTSRPASRPARLESNERHEARAIAARNEKQATMSQMGNADDENSIAPSPTASEQAPARDSMTGTTAHQPPPR